jgi:ribosomal protein S18 acetylase RimI-like enzyme
LRIVGHQPEPKLIAFIEMAKAAAVSGSTPSRASAAVLSPDRGNPAAYASIAFSSTRAKRDRSATHAQAARTSSGRETEGMAERGIQVRRARVEDAPAIARLLGDFNREYGEPIPEIETLTATCRRLLEGDEMTVLLAGNGPDGLALLRFRPALWAAGLEAYLQELYVVPALRGLGIGRGLMEAAIDLSRQRGAAGIDLNTGETDTAARGLYESMGFTNREGAPDGPSMLYYEREI